MLQADPEAAQRTADYKDKGFPAIKGRTVKKSQGHQKQGPRKKRAARYGGLPPVIGLEEDASVDSGLQQEASSESDLMEQLASPRNALRPSEGDSLSLKCEGLSSSGKVRSCLTSFKTQGCR